jgi:hypothetical protein
MEGARETSYAIVQHSPSCVRAAAVGAAYSRSGAAVPTAQQTLVRMEYAQWKIAWPGGIKPNTSALVPC